MQTHQLGDDFFAQVESQPDRDAKTRWYMCVIVNLSSLNFPDLIPSVWKHLSEHLFPGLSHSQKFQIARKIREALTKSAGIVGLAKVSLGVEERRATWFWFPQETAQATGSLLTHV